MKIKYVEELVGITRKNIRFYEEQGLLSPKRAENGYREYGQEDVERLKQIKLLRKLGVSIEDISHVLRDDIRLEECLDHQLDLLDRQKDNMTKMQTIGRRIVASHATLESLDTECYLECVEQMEKEGTHFMEVGHMDVNRKKRIGAVAAGSVMVILMIATIALLLWANTEEPIPVGILAAFIAVPVLIAGSIVAVLIARMKEIKGGEEDEASKY